MNTRTYLAIFLIATSIAIGATTSLATQASADKPDKTGLEKADENVHENTPGDGGGHQDKVFHEGLCQGDHATEALGAEGCDNPFVTDPGNSDLNRQDNK